MTAHLIHGIKESERILSTTSNQIGHLSKLEHDVFSQKLRALNATLCHMNDTLIRGIYHPMENRSRRALLNTDGQLLQGILGIATGRYVELIKSDVKNSTSQLWISQNKVIIVTNVIRKSFLKLSDAMIDQNKMMVSYQKKNDFVPRVMNRISLVGELITLINILLTEYNNLVNSLRKGFPPENMVTRETLQKILSEAN